MYAYIVYFKYNMKIVHNVNSSEDNKMKSPLNTMPAYSVWFDQKQVKRLIF